MAYLILQSQTIPDTNFTGSTATLRIFASAAFYEASTGEYVPVGKVNDLNSAYQTVACTVSSGTVTIPQVTLATTTDSNVPNAKYTAVLYSATNRRYVFLSNFFVDSSYLQTPAEGALLVEDAGSSAANGQYVFSGTSAGYDYFNVLGQAASVTLYAVVNTGSQWRIYNSIGTNLYHTSDNPDSPIDGTWATGSGSSGSLPVPTVSSNPLYSTATWEQLTISNQAFGSPGAPFQFNSPFWNVQQTKDYINTVVGDGTTPYASSIRVGKTALDEDPLVASNPIAVATNSNRINRVLSEDFSNSLATAITSISTTPTTLIIKDDTTLSTSVIVPNTLYLQFERGAMITKSGSGAIDFAGVGLVNANTPTACFESFAAGDIVWSGTLYPPEISINLWDTGDTSLSKRVTRANDSAISKYIKIVCYPATNHGASIIDASATIDQLTHLYFTDGNYLNELDTYGVTYFPAFLIKSNTRVSGSNTAYINESDNNSNNYLIYAYHLRFGGGESAGMQSNMIVEDLNIVGNESVTDLSGGNAVIHLGNCHDSLIRNCKISRAKGYATLMGSFGSSGNYAYNSGIENNLYIGMGNQLANILNGKDCWVRENHFDQTNSNNTATYVLMDFEPNDEGSVLENIWIEDNTADFTGETTSGSKFGSLVAVQAAGIDTARNIYVRRNTAVGRFLEGGAFLSGLTQGISAYGVQNLVVEDNDVIGASGRSYNIQNCAYVRATGNAASLSGDSSSGLYALYMIACAQGLVTDNEFYEVFTAQTQATGITEGELEFTVSSAASTVTAIGPTSPTRFYDFWASLALTFTLNATDYVVSTVNNDAQTLTTTIAVGTLTVMTVPSASGVDTGTDTITTSSPHNLNNSAALRYTAGSVAIGGLTTGTTYFVANKAATTFQLTATSGGAVIDLTTTGTGNQVFTPVLKTKFSSNNYSNNKADDGLLLESTGTSYIFSDYRRVISDSIAPTQLAANTDNYNPGRNAHRIDISTDASRNLTGLVFTQPPMLNGEKHEIYNAGAFNLVLVHNATSTAANRFWTNTLGNLTLLPGQRAFLEYNSTISRWMAFSSLSAASEITNVPAGSISATTVQAAINELDTEKQPLDADLTAIAGLTSAADKGIQFTGAGTAGTYDLTTAGKNLLDDANAAAQLVTLGVNATAAELNQLNDVSAYTETIAAAGALSVTKVVSKLALVGAGAVTLAAPDATMYGQQKTIEMTTDNGDVTLSLANVVGGSAATTCTWDAVGETLVLLALSTKWVVIKEFGVSLT